MNVTNPPFPVIGWAAQILPYIEQDALYRYMEQGPSTWQAALGKAPVEVPVKIYQCPSRGNRQSQAASWGSVYALNDYAGCMVEWGFEYRATAPPHANESNTFMGLITKGGHVRTDNPALTQKYSPVSATGAPDGLSNTVAVAEKAVASRQYRAQVWDWWDLPGWAHNSDWPNMRLAGNWIAPQSDNQSPRIDWMLQSDGRYVEFGFGSAHTGLFNAVFGDGSVRSLRLAIGSGGNMGYSDNSSVLYRLAHRADGQVIDSSAY
jgi:hypothetical protein